jgi:predicted RNase H-like nuclease
VLGKPRQSSVFPPPIRPALATLTREEASEVGRKTDGRRVGAQAWGIFPYIRLWDDLLNAKPDLRLRVMEVHPELSFYAMSGGTAMHFSKKKLAGAEERRLLLQSAFGADQIAAAKESLGKARFGLDDLYDALAALWTAVRVAEGRCGCVPAAPAPVDSCGLPMVIRF